MTVYVDASIHGFGRMIVCHMVAFDVEELHAMAARIGVQRKWFQDPRTMPKVSRPHYDIAKSKRASAVRYGAKEIDKYQMVVASTVAMNNHVGRYRDPLRLFSGFLSAERERLEQWLASELGVVDLI